MQNQNGQPAREHYERISDISNISPTISPSKGISPPLDRARQRLHGAMDLHMIEEVRGIETSEDVEGSPLQNGDHLQEMNMQVDQSQVLAHEYQEQYPTSFAQHLAHDQHDAHARGVNALELQAME